jgi:hypothetical protein
LPAFSSIKVALKCDVEHISSALGLWRKIILD